MDLTNSAVWFAIAIVFITTVICKVAIRTNKHAGPASDRLLPPVVNSGSIIGLLYTLFTKGFQAMIYDQYKKLGSVFTLSFFGVKATFLVGPEVSDHFFQGLDSEIGLSGALEFLSPIVGKEVFGVDNTSRKWHNGFLREGLKPGKLRDHVNPMVQEVEDYFAKWGQQGVVDLKQEMEQVLMVITGRCLLGKEVREQMFGEVCDLFHELFDNGMRITSILFPYAPTTTNQRRDKARAKLSEIFTNIVQSRKNSNHVEDDLLQNLIDSKYKDGRPTTIEEVVGLIVTLILAGQHSSSNTSTWTGAHLLNDTRCLMAVIEEQKQIIKKHGCSLDFNVFLEMDILHNSIKEALRMNPTGTLNLRKVHKNFTVRTKEGMEYEIPRGHTIVSPTVLNTKIDYIYKNPNLYDPDRFGPGRAEDKIGGKFSYTAFGGGRHACLGEAYAFLQIKVVWSHLLRNFELKLESPFPDTDTSSITMGPKGKIMVSYTRRQLLTTCGKLACP